MSMPMSDQKPTVPITAEMYVARPRQGVVVAAVALVLVVLTAFPRADPRQRRPRPERIQVAAYYFPGYHKDPLNEKAHGEGWTQWTDLKKATPRFEGHVQPKVPAWGYEDESDPRVFEKKIDAAADHGIDSFIFDWYWAEGGPFLEGALQRGYLKAANNERLKFALMWANHEGLGAVTRPVWDQVTDYVITNYFGHPSYWTIGGRPYFSIYEPKTLVQGLGGIDATRAALDNFREKAKAAGFPGIHLNLIDRGGDPNGEKNFATRLGA